MTRYCYRYIIMEHDSRNLNATRLCQLNGDRLSTATKQLRFYAIFSLVCKVFLAKFVLLD